MTDVRTVRFPSHGETLVATLHGARGASLRAARGAPIVVMAHGLSMTRDSGLAPYAERFADAGMHVLVFDYRGFGESSGSPRDIVSARSQVEDYRAALAFARTLPDVDGTRIGLWGTSYSGGVALQSACEDGGIGALVLQVPNLDNAATGLYMARHLARTDPLRGVWIAGAALADYAAGVLGLPPLYVTAVGRVGERVAYANDESLGHVNQMRGPLWQNRLALRDFLRLPIFRPIRNVQKLRCPVQIFAADRDDLTPVAPALRAAALLGERAELHRYPVNHFGVYNGELFQQVVAEQVRFLRQKLAPAPADRALHAS